MTAASLSRHNRFGMRRVAAILVLGCVVASATACGAQGSPPGASGSFVPPAGGSIDPLTSVGDFEAGANATLSVAADAPPAYSGDSFQASISGLAAGSPSRNRLVVALDLSGYGDQATFKLWVKASSLDNLESVILSVWSQNSWVAWGTKPTAAGVWQEFSLAKGSPPSSSGAIDWAAITTVYLRADASTSGAYTGDVLWRDLRISP